MTKAVTVEQNVREANTKDYNTNYTVKFVTT
jgi:hypothetical protein